MGERYENLMSCLLREVFDDTFIERKDYEAIKYSYIVQLVCRYAKNDGYVEVKDGQFVLTDKGKKLCK